MPATDYVAKPVTHDSLQARTMRRLHPGTSWCGRCGMPWGTVREHVTNYTVTAGCFPLCEGCWTLLGSPEARIEYYAAQIEWWDANGQGVSADTRRDIGRAVANGL
jgi:hypothetical protein